MKYNELRYLLAQIHCTINERMISSNETNGKKYILMRTSQKNKEK